MGAIDGVVLSHAAHVHDAADEGANDRDGDEEEDDGADGDPEDVPSRKTVLEGAVHVAKHIALVRVNADPVGGRGRKLRETAGQVGRGSRAERTAAYHGA
eukprot:CAMPEP_0184331156 /NCGR_PEP_ID=MMETSP1089-20130417/463_1 /TAXON_ID=38269 ORGANISM="Gloeochaete wittrockiana, Strain SAG46.84" /NCGR_SAMPLE_ID=MMETSP1089 /ASSEMBLY_ACC=CAM_ASM_000445 /LENGTH=99 /DNA_ID=CAMNT_0026653881 /DNA_START=34 /DNA_END=333 /DNA_ORIENTATION=-